MRPNALERRDGHKDFCRRKLLAPSVRWHLLEKPCDIIRQRLCALVLANGFSRGNALRLRQRCHAFANSRCLFLRSRCEEFAVAHVSL
jgi:hypothetical protein